MTNHDRPTCPTMTNHDQIISLHKSAEVNHDLTMTNHDRFGRSWLVMVSHG